MPLFSQEQPASGSYREHMTPAWSLMMFLVQRDGQRYLQSLRNSRVSFSIHSDRRDSLTFLKQMYKEDAQSRVASIFCRLQTKSPRHEALDA